MLSADMSPRLFKKIFRLVQDGHVKPIHPVRIFGFGEGDPSSIPHQARKTHGQNSRFAMGPKRRAASHKAGNERAEAITQRLFPDSGASHRSLREPRSVYGASGASSPDQYEPKRLKQRSMFEGYRRLRQPRLCSQRCLRERRLPGICTSYLHSIVMSPNCWRGVKGYDH